MAEAGTGFYCKVPGARGTGLGVSPDGRMVDNDAGRHASSSSIPSWY